MAERALQPLPLLVAVPSPASRVTAVPATQIQRKCGCGASTGGKGDCKECQRKKLALQAHRESASANAPAPSSHFEVGDANDAYEQEAESLAGAVMGMPGPVASVSTPAGAPQASTILRRVTPLVQRRPASRQPLEAISGVGKPAQASRQEDEEAIPPGAVLDIQRRATGDPSASESGPAPGHFDSTIAASQGGGQPLPAGLRDFMEPRFGVDLGHVRIHTGSTAAGLAASVQAQAFTLGSDIYFGANHYAPDTTSGRHLIAHELVHTLQQNPGRLSPKRLPDIASATTPSGPRIQRSFAKTMVPENLPTGTAIHNKVLPLISTANPQLFIEVAIPGANREDVDTGRTGVADLYVASKPVGVQMPNTEPEFLKNNQRFGQAGAVLKLKDHEAMAAPLGAKGAASCSGTSGVKVCRLGSEAPDKILVGDLKPASTAERLLGGAQLKNYEDGLAATRDSVNTFAAKNSQKSEPNAGQWSLTTGRITKLKVPDSIAVGKSTMPEVPLRLYNGSRAGFPITGLKGRLVVYQPPGDTSGIWVYEWLPTVLPGDVQMGKTSPEFQDALTRVDNLIKRIKPSKKKGKKKALVNRAPAPRIQRKPEPFDHAGWSTDHKAWQDDAKKVVSGDKAEGPKLVDALLEIQSRSGESMKLSAKATQSAKDLEKIERWIRWGSLLGRFRKVFGRVFDKVSDLYEKARLKLHELREKTTAKGSGESGLVGKIIKTAFKTAMVFLKLTTDKVAANLKTALEKGVDVLIEEFFSDTYIGKMVEAGADLQAKVDALEKAIEEDIQKRVEEVVKPYEEKLAFIADLGKWMGDIAGLVSKIRWAARVVQCLTPPGIGCLKLLLQEVAEKALEMVVESCWFQKYIIGPIFNTLDFFKKLPGEISAFIISHVKGWLPLDDALKEKMFPSAAPATGALGTQDLGCDNTTLSPEAIRMRLLLDTHGRRKVELLIKLMEKRGVGDRQEISVDQIKRMDAALKKINEKQLQDALTQDPVEGGATGDLDMLAQSIQGGGTPGADGSGGGGGKDGDPAAPGAKPKHGAVVARAGDAPYAGGGERSDQPVSVGFAGTSKDHPAKSAQTITINLFYEGELISQVTGVKTVVGTVTEEVHEGVNYRVITYVLQQGIRLRHKVPGMSEFGIAKGASLTDHFPLGAKAP